MLNMQSHSLNLEIYGCLVVFDDRPWGQNGLLLSLLFMNFSHLYNLK